MLFPKPPPLPAPQSNYDKLSKDKKDRGVVETEESIETGTSVYEESVEESMEMPPPVYSVDNYSDEESMW